MSSYPVQGSEFDAEPRHSSPDEPYLGPDTDDAESQTNQRASPTVFWLFPIMIILCTLALLSPGPMVYDQEAVRDPAGDVEFAVTVQNTNLLMQKSATIWCEVTTEQGNTYSQSRTVTLDQYQRASFVIVVDVPPSEVPSSSDHEVRLR